MTQGASETVQSIYAAFARGDVAAVVAAFHPDAEVHCHAPRSVPYGGVWRGREQVQAWFVALGSTMAHDKVEAETMVASGDEVAVRGIEGGRSTATGRTYEAGFVHFWKVKNGLVVRFDDFIDSATVAATIAA